MIAIVSNIDLLRRRSHRTRRRACKLGATLCVLLAPYSAAAQTPAAPQAQPRENLAADTLKFLAGGATAFLAHESGHLLFDAIFDAGPHIKRVQFGPVPFFAVAHRADLSPR